MHSSQGQDQDHSANTELDYENSVFELVGSVTQAGISDLMKGLGQGCISVPLQALLVPSRGICHCSLTRQAHKLCKAVAEVQTLGR